MTWIEAYRFRKLSNWEPPWGVTFETKFRANNGDMRVVMTTRDGTTADMLIVGPIDADLFGILDRCADHMLMAQAEREKKRQVERDFACVRRARGTAP